MKFKSWKWSEKETKRTLPKLVSSQGDCMHTQSYTLWGSTSRSSHSEVNKHITKTWRWREKTVPRVAAICLKCPVSIKKKKICQKIGKYEPYTRVKRGGATKTSCENDQIILDLIVKAFKVTIINMLKKLKEAMIKEGKYGINVISNKEYKDNLYF